MKKVFPLLKCMYYIGIRKNDTGTLHHEANFEEAIRSVNFAYNRTILPPNVQQILKDEKLTNLSSNVGN